MSPFHPKRRYGDRDGCSWNRPIADIPSAIPPFRVASTAMQHICAPRMLSDFKVSDLVRVPWFTQRCAVYRLPLLKHPSSRTRLLLKLHSGFSGSQCLLGSSTRGWTRSSLMISVAHARRDEMSRSKQMLGVRSRMLIGIAASVLVGWTTVPSLAAGLTPQEAKRIGLDAYLYGYS